MNGGSLPAAAQELADAFVAISDEGHRGTPLADEIRFPQTKPPTDIRLDHETVRLLAQFDKSYIKSLKSCDPSSS